MLLVAGERLGPYEIVAQVGAGGMGRGLPRARLHDVGPNYLVMELVEGEAPKVQRYGRRVFAGRSLDRVRIERVRER